MQALRKLEPVARETRPAGEASVPSVVFRLLSDWYWEQDAELRFTRFEGAMATESGQQPAEAIGLRRWELPTIVAVSSTWEEHRATLEARLPFRDFEYSRVHADGQLHYVSVSGEPVFDARGRFAGYRGVSSDITKRKRAEDALRLAELNYRSIFDNAVEGMYRVDAAGRVVMANQALARMLGYDSPDTMLSRIGNVAHEVYVEPGDRRRYRALLAANGVISSFETRWRRADGSVIWVSMSGRMASDPAGGYFHLGSAVDITERKREERLLALEHSVARLLAEAKTPDEGVLSVMEAVCRSEGWGCARYFKHDEEADEMRLKQSWHDGSPAMVAFTAGSEHLRFRRGEGLTGAAWVSGEPLWVADVRGDARVAMRALAERAGVHGALVLPVAAEGRTIGVLSVSSAGIREPDERLQRTLRLVCGHIGQFLQRKLAEQVMRESEARFRSLTELSSDFYWETDAEHRVTRMTHGGRHQTILGSSLLGRRRWEIPSELPGPEGWAAHRATMEAHQPFREFEFGRLNAQGMVRALSISGEPVFDEAGRFTGYRGIGKDITARKQEERLRARNLRYQEALARFGESTLGRRAADALIEDAVATAHEALGGAVAYLRCTGPQVEVVALAGIDAAVAPFDARPALERVLARGELHAFDAAGALLPAALCQGRASGLLKPVMAEGRPQGALCVLADPHVPLTQDEARFLEAAGSVLSAGLRRIDSEGRLAFLAQFDALTGLPNRALLRDRFSQMIVQAKRHGSMLGVLFIDLDHFKHVNDTLGHAGGDQLLREVARRLQSCVRAGDTVARISGDEFAVLLGDLAQAEDAALVAQKILDGLAAPIDVAGSETFVSASIGIAAFPADGADAEALLGAADAAMYRAKQAGRSGYQFFTPEIDQRTRERARLGSELRRALEREEFELVYQPKFDLRTGMPCAAEALLRWRRPDGEVVSPAQFVPVLEETGLIVQVGEWVVKRACADLKAWRAAGATPVPVAVNLSARQFRQQDLDARIRALLAEAGVAPGLIELEITESQLMHDPEHAIRMVSALHREGIGIAIDDFGTGYSSLSYLTRFPVSALKIDRSFVGGVPGNAADAAIVRAIIDLAHTLGFRVVAEGVETEDQAAFLRSLGCEHAQGYLFARPMAAAQFQKLLGDGVDS